MRRQIALMFEGSFRSSSLLPSASKVGTLMHHIHNTKRHLQGIPPHAAKTLGSGFGGLRVLCCSNLQLSCMISHRERHLEVRAMPPRSLLTDQTLR
eukprot:4678417-Amphidinium_carterae.1